MKNVFTVIIKSFSQKTKGKTTIYKNDKVFKKRQNDQKGGCLSVCYLQAPKPFVRSSPNLACAKREISRMLQAKFQVPGFTESHKRDGKGGQGQFWQIRERVRDFQVILRLRVQIPRGATFYRKGDFLFFNQLFAFRF